MSPPDRPIAPVLAPVRHAVRSVRLGIYRARLRSKGEFGKDVVIGRGAVLLPPEFCRLGDNVWIGRGLHLECNLDIGSDVLISSRVSIVSDDHRFDDPDVPIHKQGRKDPGVVVLEGNNLVGVGATIIAPSRIGRGCIVGAGSIVTRDLPADTVCVGAPAKPIRSRYQTASSTDESGPRCP